MNLYLRGIDMIVKQLEIIAQLIEKQKTSIDALNLQVQKNNQLLDRIQISTNRIANDGGF